jgi:hypothetical protein
VSSIGTDRRGRTEVVFSATNSSVVGRYYYGVQSRARRISLRVIHEVDDWRLANIIPE